MTKKRHGQGGLDGIHRVVFGRDFGCWLVKLAFIDAVQRLSPFQLPLTRHLQIDIDDVFVGKAGLRMTKADVHVRSICLLLPVRYSTLVSS